MSSTVNVEFAVIRAIKKTTLCIIDINVICVLHKSKALLCTRYHNFMI